MVYETCESAPHRWRAYRGISFVMVCAMLLIGPAAVNAGTRLQERCPRASNALTVQAPAQGNNVPVSPDQSQRLDSERACVPGNNILDPSWEATVTGTLTNAFWVATSTNFGTPLCDVATCGSVASAVPRTGSFWAWNGGISAAETATIAQTVTFPTGATSVTLNYFLRIGAVTTPFVDTLVVSVDNVAQQTFTEPSVAEATYTLRSVNLLAFADGNPHTIKFTYTHPGTGTSNFNVDDVTLDVVCGAAPNAKDSIGAVSSTCFFLRNTNDSGNADAVACYGGSGQVPVAGDYDNDGDDTIGVYDQASGTFFLRNANTPGPADVTVQFGAVAASSIPIIGDWDGNGTDTIGIYDNVTGTFFLRNSNTPGAADVTAVLGVGGPNVFPVVGDWDGNGSDTIGVYSNGNCAIFLRNTNATGPADITFCFGPAGASFRPVSGDWDNNNTFGIGIYDTSTGATFLRNSLTNGPADSTFSFGAAGFAPVSGDWDNLP